MVVWVVALLVSMPAHAADAPASVPPDIVRLKDGGLVRGTIMEMVPGKMVDVALPSGSTRNIPMSDVAWAGRAADDPGPGGEKPKPEGDAALAKSQAAAPPPAPAGASIIPLAVQPGSNATHLRLRAEDGQEGLTFHIRTGSNTSFIADGRHQGGVAIETYQRLCTAPCEVDVEPGTHQFGLSLDDGRVEKAGSVVSVAGPSTVVGEYQSYLKGRIAGLLLVVLGPVVGGIVAMQSTQSCQTITNPPLAPTNFCHPDYPYFVHGAVISITGVLLGGIVAILSSHDTARVHKE
jgi:hypothetical protein